MSRSFKKNPIGWCCDDSAKKDKQRYNRVMRRKDRQLLKDYDDDTILQKHKRDGQSKYGWGVDGKYSFFITDSELRDKDLAESYAKLMRK